MSEFTEELTQLESEIRRMKIDYDRFFNGALPTPPDELRLEIARTLRRLQGHHVTALAERFRLNALEARFNTLSELCNRKLREHEAGVLAAAAAASRDPYDGVVFAGRTSRDEAMLLYEELYGQSGRRKKTDFGSFLEFLENKAAKIRKVTGSAAVQFRIVKSKGRLSLKAKPVKDGQP